MCLTLKLLNTSPAQPSTACLTILAVARSPVRVAFLVPVPVAVGVSECHGCPEYIRRYAVHDMAQAGSDTVSGKTCAAHQYGFALIPERPDANPRKEVAAELSLLKAKAAAAARAPPAAAAAASKAPLLSKAPAKKASAAATFAAPAAAAAATRAASGDGGAGVAKGAATMAEAA